MEYGQGTDIPTPAINPETVSVVVSQKRKILGRRPTLVNAQ